MLQPHRDLRIPIKQVGNTRSLWSDKHTAQEGQLALLTPSRDGWGYEMGR